MPAQTVIKIRRDTAANWTSTNPTLASGELGFETNTNKLKVGNGSTAWTSLAYASGAGGLVVSETAPTSPEVGSMWFNSSEAKTYVYYDSSWVEITPAVAGPQGATGATGATGPTGPTGPAARTLISTTVTTAGATSATISSIPQTYKALQMTISFTGSVGGPSASSITFNGSSTGNYSASYYYTSNSTGAAAVTPSGYYQVNQSAIILPGLTSGAQNVEIPDYAVTSRGKNLAFYGFTGYITSGSNIGSGYWGGPSGTPAAISSIGLAFSNTTGSTVYTIELWGIN
jgi:hypothetical protein